MSQVPFLLHPTPRRIGIRGPRRDLKPSVAEFDRPDGEPRGGRLATVPLREGITPADLGERGQAL